MVSASRRHAGGRRGFALLDAIIAAVILGISLTAIIGLAGRAVSSQTLGEEIQIAAMLADEQLNLVLARGPENYAQRFAVRGSCDAPFDRFRYSLDLGGGTGVEPYQVRATILWEGSTGEKSIVVETLIAGRPGDDADPLRQPPQPVERIQ